MKKSMFNIEQEVEDGLLIYNTLSSGILFLNEIYTKEYEKIDRGINNIKPDLINELERGKMLVEDSLDEVGFVKFINNSSRMDDNGVGITIAPTMECNFSCPYCYEEGVRYNRMTRQVADETIEFIKKSDPDNKGIGICWYGGEPLLGIRTIEYITRQLFADEKVKEKFQAEIVTNGYYLNEENALLLKELGITRAQITLDGPPEIHDQRRTLINGKPTFHKIMENIKKVHEIIKIDIRVNVDRSNIERVMDILDILEVENLKNKVGFYIAAVDDAADLVPNPDCFSDKDFSKEELELYVQALKKGFNLISVPGPMFGICGAVAKNSYVIDPLGNLYKCWNEIGRIESCVGNVYEGPVFNSVLSDYLNYEGVSEQKCQSCAVLPTCLGGCPYIKKNTGEARCSSIRFNSKKIASLLFELKK